MREINKDFPKYLYLLKRYIEGKFVKRTEAPNYMYSFLRQYTILYFENIPAIAKLYINLLRKVGRQSVWRAVCLDTILSLSYHTGGLETFLKVLLKFAKELEMKNNVNLNIPREKYNILKERFNRMWPY